MIKSSINWEEELENLQHLSDQGLSLKAIGALYGVSKQRVRQIFSKYDLEHKGVRYLVAIRKAAEEVDKKLKWGNKEETALYKLKRAKFMGKKANATRNGIPFELNYGELDFPDICPVLGIPIDYDSDGISENSPSFDRIDPSKGYVSGNVVIMSWRANRIKNNGTADEHKRIYEYLIKLNEQS